MIGETLAHFCVTAKLGEGGMGSVWRAQDTKLGRDVALKFLPEALSADPERMARFTREAQVLASLNHPNIAAIYSVEEARRGDTDEPLRFLVMELVEGENLEERLVRGPLALDEALRITLQIAVGLEEAHERGIVHRDLKPANISLASSRQSQAQTVKILDFGLAKAFDAPATDSVPPGAGQRLSLSPTMTGMATQVGMLLGTAAYMSPEQARGEPVDRRADIWALGVVLMEMMTGKVVHRGKTISDTLASVLARDPAWDELPSSTPRPIRRLLERCLEKDSHERLRDVGEARIAIERYLADPTADEVAATVATATAAVPAWKRILPWAATAALAVALVATFFAMRPGPPEPRRALRLSLTLPREQNLFSGFGASAVLSPDGSRMAYVMATGSRNDLYVRSLDQSEGTLLVKGDGQMRPYQAHFSPDGQWIGFVTPTEMRKVPVSGGTSIKLCDVDRSRGATWGPDDTIVFTPSPNSALMQMPGGGGEPRPFTALDEAKGEVTHRWPQWLPDGRAVLFTAHTAGSDFDKANIELFVPATGERRVVHRGGTHGRYVAAGADRGFLVYSNAGSLFAAPFDPRTLEVVGSVVPVVEGVTAGSEGSAQFSTSPDGKLVYAQGAVGNAGHSIVWVDRDGRVEPLWEDERFYRNPAFSADGTRLAVDIVAEGQADIWIYDVERAVPTRLTFNDEEDVAPVWSPDGEYIYYGGETDGATSIYRKRADGSGEPESLLEAEKRNLFPSSISPDGRMLAYRSVAGGNPDIAIFDLKERGAPRTFLDTPFIETSPKFSPDGRWLAYVSNESGTFEVYVRPVEGPGKWQLSSGGGTFPAWSPDGKELFFWVLGTAYRAGVETQGSGFRAGRAEELFEGNFIDVGNNSPTAVAPGGRFVAFHSKSAAAKDSHQHVEVVLNWPDELLSRFGNRGGPPR